MDKKPNGTWEDWIADAYNQRISLSSAGFYKTPGIGYSFETNTGTAFNYFTYGVACSEVEIDCLTGDHQVRQFLINSLLLPELFHPTLNETFLADYFYE